MAQFQTVVYIGDRPIKITADSLTELLKESGYVESLNEATEGRECTPFYRKTQDGFEYYGFRDAAGNEVNFGYSTGKDPDRPLYAKRQGYVNKKDPRRSYTGFQRPQLESGVPAHHATVNGSANHTSKPAIGQEQIDALRGYLEKAFAGNTLEDAIKQAKGNISRYPQPWLDKATDVIIEYERRLVQAP